MFVSDTAEETMPWDPAVAPSIAHLVSASQNQLHTMFTCLPCFWLFTVPGDWEGRTLTPS